MRSGSTTSAWIAACAAVVAFAPAPVRAGDADRLDAALAAWDLHAARTLLDQGVEGLSRERTLQAWGLVHLLEGDYKKTEDTLARASSGEAQHLATIARASRILVSDLTRTLTPSGRFAIWHATGSDELAVPYIIEAAEGAFDALPQRLGVVPSTPIRIEVLPSVDALAAASGVPEADLRSSGAVAMCRYNKLMLVSPSQFPWGYPYADTVAHELAHYLLTLAAGDRVPVWMQEAVAKYLEPVWRGAEPGALTRGMRDLLSNAIAQGRLIPPATLRQGLTRLGGMEDTALAFAELSSLAGFLERNWGPTVFARLAAELARTDADRAVQRVTGRSFAAVADTWSRELAQGGATPTARPIAGVFVREVEEDLASRLAPEAASRVRLGDLLRADGRFRAAATEYRKVLAAGGAPHPAVVARLAGSLLEAGLPDDTLAALDSAALDEDELPALAAARGRALAALGRPKDALAPLLSAVRSDPYEPAVHAALEQVFAATGDPGRAERERRLAAIGR